MIRKYGMFAAAAFFASVIAPVPAKAQLWTWTKDQIAEYTKAWTGERLADGRPKVSDNLIERAKGLSMEELNINWNAPGATAAPPAAAGGGRGGGGGLSYSQFVGDLQPLHPGKKMAGRAFTVLFMPARPDLDFVVNSKAKRGWNQHAQQPVRH